MFLKILKLLGKGWMMGAVILAGRPTRAQTLYAPEQQPLFDSLDTQASVFLEHSTTCSLPKSSNLNLLESSGSTKAICDELINKEIFCYRLKAGDLTPSTPKSIREHTQEICDRAYESRNKLTEAQEASCDNILVAKLSSLYGETPVIKISDPTKTQPTSERKIGDIATITSYRVSKKIKGRPIENYVDERRRRVCTP